MKKVKFIIYIVLFILIYYTLICNANYFVASPIIIAKEIIKDATLPRKIFETENFWKSHANFFTNYPNSALLIAILSMVADLPLHLILQLSILYIIWIILLIVILKLFAKRESIRILFVFLLSVYTISQYPRTWNINYHSLGYISHLLILYIVTKQFLSNKRSNDINYIIVILIVYFLSLFSYYATTFFSIWLIFSIIVWSIVLSKKFEKVHLYIFLIFLIIYLISDSALVLTLGQAPSPTTILESIWRSFLRLLQGLPPSEQLYQLGNPYEEGTLDYIFRIIRYSFAGFFIVVILLLMFYKFNSYRLRLIILIFAVTSVSLLESFPYAIVKGGEFATRYLMLYAQIIVLSVFSFVVQNLYIKNRVIFYALLVYVSVSVFAFFYQGYISLNFAGPTVRSRVALPEYELLVMLVHSNRVVYSDHQISGELWLAAIKLGVENYVTVSPFLGRIYSIYKSITTYNLTILHSSLRPDSVLVFSHFNFISPVYGDVWGFATPPFGLHNEVWVKEVFSVVFDSGRLFVVCI